LAILNICYCRKICQHCRCPREDHNIIEDDAREGCSVYLGDANYSGFPSDDDSGCALDEYAWIPPGLNAEQVSTDAKWIFFLFQVHSFFPNIMEVNWYPHCLFWL